MSDFVLEFENVSMTYPAGDSLLRTVLAPTSFSIAAGNSIALVGRSGSGKSTLLHLAAGILTPSSGSVSLYGNDLTNSSEKRRTQLRGADVGLIFQFFHLLPHLSVQENVALPGWIAGQENGQVGRRAVELLDRVGLADRRNDQVGKLSGGEMQRVAICRAMLRSPRLVLADEPTGSLDESNGQLIMEILHSIVSEQGSTLLFVTHSLDLATVADEQWQLHDGVLDTGRAS